MAELPAMPHWGDAYIADTRHLTLEEHGAYRLLLDIAWRSENRALPNNDRRLAQMLGITPARWAKLRPAVMAFWTLSEHGWQQKKLLKVWQETIKRRDKRREAAEARWGAKSLKDKGAGDANAYANGDAKGYPTKTITKVPNGTIEVSDDTFGKTKLLPAHVVEIWNKRAEEWGLPQVKTLSRERLQRLNARIREHPLEDFMAAFDAIARSGFLRGDNKNGWKADFDFFTQKSSFIKLVEGSYDH